MSDFEYRLAVGWITKAALEASSAYLIENFPVQSDQISKYVNPWGPPDDRLTTFPTYTRFGQYSNTTQWSDGPVAFDLGFKYFTEAMQYYWEYSLIFGNATLQTKPITVKTRKSAGVGDFGVFQCYANRAKPNTSDFKRGVRGMNDYIQHCVGGVEIF